MMISPHIAQVPERSRVSIVERLVPSLSLALTALSGAAAAVWMQMVLAAMRSAENAGYVAFYNAMAEVYAVGGVGLIAAAAIGPAGVATSAVRMFTANSRSSPPGALFLLPAVVCLVPPILADYAGSLAVSAVRDAVPGGVSSVSGNIDILCWLAIGVAVFSLIILAAFTFIPFSSRNGRKVTPVLFLIGVEVAAVALCSSYLFAVHLCWSLAQAHY